MAEICILHPKALGSTSDSAPTSILHKDLCDYYKDRNTANVVWATAAVLVKSGYPIIGAKYDKNGELTIESLNEIVGLRNLDKNVNLSLEKQEAGATNTNNEDIEYNTLDECLEKCIEFENKHEDLVAYPTRKPNGKFIITVANKTASNSDNLTQARFNGHLNKRLLALMRGLGFDASTDTELDSVTGGIFDPTNAENTAEKLKTVIRICKGERGENAFPEEFSHFMIRGLWKTPLVTRLISTIRNNSLVEAILGEDYEKYKELYEGDQEKLIEEAAGKLLEKHIKGEAMPQNKPAKSLVGRLWDFIKGLFGKASVDDVDNAIAEAHRYAGDIANIVTSNTIFDLFDPNEVFKGGILYKVAEVEKKITQAKTLAEKQRELLARELNVKEHRNRYGDNDELFRVIRLVERNIERNMNTQGIMDGLGYIAKMLGNADSGKLAEIKKRINAIEKTGSAASISIYSAVCRDTLNIINGYSDYINTLKTAVYMQSIGELDISPDDAKQIQELAIQVDGVMSSIRELYKTSVKGVVLRILAPLYIDEGNIRQLGKNAGEVMQLAGSLDIIPHDIGRLEPLFNSLGESSDLVSSLLNKFIKEAKAKRDQVLQEINFKIRAADKRLKEAGGNTNFMYERDAKGKLTGRIISDIDFEKYFEERAKFAKELREEVTPDGKPLSYSVKQARWKKWKEVHEQVLTTYDDDGNKLREENIPNKRLYEKALPQMNSAQKEYYDTMLQIKREMDAFLPPSYAHLYNCVYIRANLAEEIGRMQNPKDMFDAAMRDMGDAFLRREDDTDYGEQEEEREKDELEQEYDEQKEKDKKEGKKEKKKKSNVQLDFEGNPIRAIPVFYTRRLKNMDALSTDFTGSMMAYSAMATNYYYMHDIEDRVELVLRFMREREVLKTVAGYEQKEALKVLGKEYDFPYTEQGGRAYQKARRSVDRMLYGVHKIDMGVINIPGAKYNVDIVKTLDALRQYTGNVNLGLNPLSGLTNVLVGKTQMFIEAMGGRFFNYKDTVNATKKYYSWIIPYLGELNSTKRESTLALLQDKFDPSEEFFESLRQQGLFKGPISRAAQQMNLLILQNIGEHYLHFRTVLAMLEHTKFTVGRKETSWLDSYEKVEIKDEKGRKIGKKMFFKEGTKDEKGNLMWTYKMEQRYELLRKQKDKTAEDWEQLKYYQEIKDRTDAKEREMKLKMSRVNQRMHGAFNQDDRGTIHDNAFGRLVMQFRQWMPAFYHNRFGRYHEDAILGEDEGYYRTAARYLWNVLKELRYGKFEYLKSINDPNKELMRYNIIRASTEVGIFMLLTLSTAMLAGWKDDDDNGAARLAYYEMCRMKADVGAGTPSPSMLKNIWTILKSPAAAMDTFNNLFDLIYVPYMFDEIETGKYAGWTQWEKRVYRSLPIYRPISNAVDLWEGDNQLFTYFDW